MKKFFLIISVALGAVIPFGKASAGPICTNTYVDGSTETSYSREWLSWTGDSSNPTSVSCSCQNSSNKKIKNSVCTYQNIKSEREFDTNGNETKEIVSNCSGGTCNITATKDTEWTYHDDGNPTEYSYEHKDSDGKMLGSGSGQYDDDWNEIYYEFDEKYYYENGQISSDRYVERGEVTGYKEFEKEYYENGQLTFEKEYYESPDFVGNFSGKYYYENGQLSWTNVWGTDENDIYTENSVTYDENGNITSEENYTSNPDGTETQDNMYYEYDDDGKLISRTNEICNNRRCSSVSYDANGDLLSVNGNEVTENCASADSNGVCTKCKDGFDDIDGYCNKIRWTPAEAAKVLRDDNTNEVTITFKK